MSIEKLILENLTLNEEYVRKVLPFLKEEYFQDAILKKVFCITHDFIVKYNALPTNEAVIISAESDKNLTETEFKILSEIIAEYNEPEKNTDWLVDETEKFCKGKALYNAIMESIHIMDGKTKNEKTEAAIPSMLSDALAVSFDTHIGHDYIEDSDNRFEFYHQVEKRVPFDIEFLNTITSGGLPNKTLNIIMAGCVHPDTKIKIRYRKHNTTGSEEI